MIVVSADVASGARSVAVVLVSGGLDSTTCLAVAQAAGHQVVAVSFDYGQRHAVELDCARRVVAHYAAAGVVTRHLVFPVGLFREIGGSALTADVDVPRDRDEAAMGAGGVPVTYVPARNLVFLSYATGVAETSGAQAIYIGVNALDYSGYPDCRPEFIEAFARTANLATRVGDAGETLRIEAPLQHLSKADIVRLGTRLGAPLHLTHSCYDPDAAGVACGRCDSCLLRIKGFREAGAVDPVAYQVAVDWSA